MHAMLLGLGEWYTNQMAALEQDTQKEILDIAKNACTAFQQYKDQCVTYLELYGPLLFNMVVQYLQPQLCITLGYCSTGHMQKFLPGATLMVS